MLFCLRSSRPCVLELVLETDLLAALGSPAACLRVQMRVKFGQGAGRGDSLPRSDGCIVSQMEIRGQGIFLARLLYHFADMGLTIC